MSRKQQWRLALAKKRRQRIVEDYDQREAEREVKRWREWFENCGK